MARLSTLLLIATSCFCFNQSTFAQDWPALRGADGYGTLKTNGPLSRSEKVELKVRWKKKIGSGYSSVVIAGNRAITLFTDGEEDKIGCFNSANGNSVWEFVLGPKFPGENGSFDGPISTPLIHAAHVYALSCQGRFVCVKLSDGKLVWEKSLVEDYKSKQPMYGFATSPLAIGDQVILQVGAKDKMTVAFDAKTGNEKWAGGNDSINSQSPAVVTVSGKQVLLAPGGKLITGFDPQTGDVLCEHPHEGDNASAVMPVPVGDGKILLTLSDLAARTYVLQPGDEGKVNVSNDWKNRSIKNTYNIPSLSGGNVFAFSTRILTCVDPATGNAKWKSRKPGDGFLITVDDHMLIITKKGSLHVARASGDKYSEVAAKKVFEDLVWTVPSFSDGSVFIRSLGEIARVDIVAEGGSQTAAVGSAKLPVGKAFNAFVAALGTVGDEEKTKLIEEFLASQKSFPVIEDGIAHFIYRGEATDVALACDVFGARQERKLVSIEGTNLKYYTMKLEPDQRVNYAFLVNYKPQPDELNPRKSTSSMYAGEMEFSVRLRGEAPLEMSWFGMSDWKQPAFLDSIPETLSGKMVERTFKPEAKSDAGEEPNSPAAMGVPFNVYLPPGYEENKGKRYPLIMVVAAPRMEESGQFVQIADKLFANDANAVNPAIMIVPKGQMMPGMDKGLVALVDKEFRTTGKRESRSVIGFGFSGGAALNAMGTSPELYGAVSAQSPLVFDADLRSILSGFEKIDKPTLVYLDWGRHDMHNPVENWDLRKGCVEMYDGFKKNQNLTILGGQVNDSTDWSSWRNRFDAVLSAMTKEAG